MKNPIAALLGAASLISALPTPTSLVASTRATHLVSPLDSQITTYPPPSHLFKDRLQRRGPVLHADFALGPRSKHGSRTPTKNQAGIEPPTIYEAFPDWKHIFVNTPAQEATSGGGHQGEKGSNDAQGPSQAAVDSGGVAGGTAGGSHTRSSHTSPEDATFNEMLKAYVNSGDYIGTGKPGRA